MSEYIPDPIERMEMRWARVEELYIDGDNFTCCVCGGTGRLADAMSLNADPASPPIHQDCYSPPAKVGG